MKNKILTMVLTTMMIASVVVCIFMHEKNEKLENIIEQKEVDLEKKSTEIAKLEDVVRNKDSDLKANKKVIDEKVAKIKKLKTKINKLNAEISEMKYGSFSQTASVYDGAKAMTVNASAYTPFCVEGCNGQTRSGYNVSKTIYYNGMRIIATDPSVIPMYSIVKIEGFNEKFIALDTGGAIKGSKIDILFKTENEANRFGRKNIKLQILRYGK